jgi:hypothetical protein
VMVTFLSQVLRNSPLVFLPLGMLYGYQPRLDHWFVVAHYDLSWGLRIQRLLFILLMHDNTIVILLSSFKYSNGFNTKLLGASYLRSPHCSPERNKNRFTTSLPITLVRISDEHILRLSCYYLYHHHTTLRTSCAFCCQATPDDCMSIFIVFTSVHSLQAKSYQTFNLIDRNHSDVTMYFFTHTVRPDNVPKYHGMLYYVSRMLNNVDRTN